jgi:hypothetical protein
LQNSGVGESSWQLPPGLGRCIGVTNVTLSEEAVIKEGLWGKELSVVRELEARLLASEDVGCNAEESTLTIGEAEWGSVATGERGSVHVADIDESRAGEASAADSECRGRGGLRTSLFAREYRNRRDGADIVGR